VKHHSEVVYVAYQEVAPEQSPKKKAQKIWAAIPVLIRYQQAAIPKQMRQGLSQQMAQQILWSVMWLRNWTQKIPVSPG
jgi:hypothetical protein